MKTNTPKESALESLRVYGRQCLLCQAENVQLHHNLLFAGKRVQDPETILPLCPDCHSQANKKEVREKLDWIMLSTMPSLEKYSKAEDLLAKKEYLINKYGVFQR